MGRAASTIRRSTDNTHVLGAPNCMQFATRCSTPSNPQTIAVRACAISAPCTYLLRRADYISAPLRGSRMCQMRSGSGGIRVRGGCGCSDQNKWGCGILGLVRQHVSYYHTDDSGVWVATSAAVRRLQLHAPHTHRTHAHTRSHTG